MEANISPKTSSYSDAAQEFIQTVRQHSPQAGDCLDQIQADYGSRTAYLAAFALVQLKNRQVETNYPPSQRDLYAFTFCEEMGETLEAMRLYEQATGHLFPSDRSSAPL